MERVYLDHASTSPLRPVAAAAMSAWFDRSSRGEVGDPSRSHAPGLAARAELEDARTRIARFFGARPREVLLCSGATEAIATVAHGTTSRGPHSVFSAVEHAAVRSSAGAEATPVAVDHDGRVDVDHFVGALRADTAVAHLQWGNHEVGSLQPIADVAAHCRANGVLLHVDAAQAAGRVPIDFGASGIDLMSVSGHKFGAPTGTGALLVRRGLRLDPLMVGGDQERGRRAGMEHIVGAIGFAAALDELSDTRLHEATNTRMLSTRVIEWAGTTDGVDVLGSTDHRLPHIVCLRVADVEPQAVVIGLDRAGIAVHSGNSCSSEALEPSPVLAAMGADAAHSLRISFGWTSTHGDVDRLLDRLPAVLADLRSLRT